MEKRVGGAQKDVIENRLATKEVQPPRLAGSRAQCHVAACFSRSAEVARASSMSLASHVWLTREQKFVASDSIQTSNEFV